MKFKLSIITMTLSASTAFGTTVSISTGGAATPQNLIDSTGSSLAGFGYAAFGVYGGGAITDVSSLVSSFTIGNFDDADIIGSDLSLTTTDIKTFSGFGGSISADGFETNLFTQASTSGFTGQNISVVFWKGGSGLSTATEAVVFELDATYATPGATPLSFNFIEETGTLIFGTNQFQTAVLTAVPEPSSVALLGLGSVALLLRRRR